MIGAPHWSPDDTERLGKLIDAGISSGRAARTLQVTRSAASGRAYRLGWRFGVPRAPEQRVPSPKCLLRREPVPRLPRSKMSPEDRPVAFSCQFDRETHAEIDALAKAHKTSKAQMIRHLVEWGLQDVRSEDGAE